MPPLHLARSLHLGFRDTGTALPCSLLPLPLPGPVHTSRLALGHTVFVTRACLLGPSKSSIAEGGLAGIAPGFASWPQRAGSTPAGTWAAGLWEQGLSRTPGQCRTKAQPSPGDGLAHSQSAVRPGCLPHPTPSPGPPTCSFQRKSRRAVDSTCWACRYRASTKTEMMMGVTTFSATLVACSGLQAGGR